MTPTAVADPHRVPTADLDDIFESKPVGSGAPAVVRATDLTGVHVLKHDNLFMLADSHGDIQLDGRGLGLYAGDTRVLSTYDLRLNGIRPVVLRAGPAASYRGTIQLTNPDFFDPPSGSANENEAEVILRRHSLGVVRERAIGEGFGERISVQNYTTLPERARLTFRLDADYADIFELRGFIRAQRGERLPTRGDGGLIEFGYRGLDGATRRTFVRFSPAADAGRLGRSRAGHRPGHAGARHDAAAHRERDRDGGCLGRGPASAGQADGRSRPRTTLTSPRVPTARTKRPTSRSDPRSAPTRPRRFTVRGVPARPRSRPRTCSLSEPWAGPVPTFGCCSTADPARASATSGPACRGSAACSAATRSSTASSCSASVPRWPARRCRSWRGCRRPKSTNGTTRSRARSSTSCARASSRAPTRFRTRRTTARSMRRRCG